MEEELGCSIAEVFSSISERPIAAASLGQARPPAPLCHVQWSREAVLERTGSRVHCLVLCCAFAFEPSFATARRVGVCGGSTSSGHAEVAISNYGPLQVQRNILQPMRVLLV